MRSISEEIATLSPKQRELLELLLEEEGLAVWQSPVAPQKGEPYSFKQSVSSADTTIAAHSGMELVIGPVPLTPIQHWFFENNFLDRHHYNQAALLEMPPHLVDATRLQQAVQALLMQHDALRLRFIYDQQIWRQNNAGFSKDVPFSFIDLATRSEAEQELVFEVAVTELQMSLNLSRGPLLRVALFYLGEHKPSRLLIVVHHLAVDIISWRILLSDLQVAYQQLCQGQAVRLPHKTTSFKEWAERLVDYAQSQSLRREFDYWMSLPWSAVTHLSVDDVGSNSQESARTVLVALSVHETQALMREVPKRYHLQVSDVLLASILHSIASWAGNRAVLIDLEGHGREDIIEGIDLSRTVGWFTSIVPVLLHVDNADNGLGGTLQALKEHLRNMPNGGIGLGLLRYLCRDSRITDQLRRLPRAEIIFNYQGRSARALSEDTLFRPSQASCGPAISLRGARSHLLRVDGTIVDDCLHIEWTYSENVHRRSTIEHLAYLHLEALRTIISLSHSLSASTTSHVVS